MYGILSRYNLTEDEKELFIEYLGYIIGNPSLDFVQYLLGDDYLKFIDILAGTSFKVPCSRLLEKDLEAVKMYSYVKGFDFSEDSILRVSKMYNRTALSVKKSIYKIAKNLGVEDTLDGEALNNYLSNIKPLDKNKYSYKDKNKNKEDTSEYISDVIEDERQI